MATVVAAMLWLLGVQMAYVFGLITFVLNFVPNLGPLIATCLPMPLVVFDPGEEPPGFRSPRRLCFGGRRCGEGLPVIGDGGGVGVDADVDFMTLPYRSNLVWSQDTLQLLGRKSIAEKNYQVFTYVTGTR